MRNQIRKVVYTSLTGSIDKLKNPQFVLKGWDYICFSNDIVTTEKNNVWQIRSIPFNSKNSRRLSRFAKIKAHEVLTNYDYSLYLDANVEIVSDTILHRINQLIEEDQLISLIPHPVRDCIYDEIQECIIIGKEFARPLKKIRNYLKENNYPKHFGLFENGLMLRKHNDPKMIELNNCWWDLYINFSQRDQVSLGFLMWKYNIQCVAFFPKGISVRNSPAIEFHKHKISIQSKIKIRLIQFLNKVV